MANRESVQFSDRPPSMRTGSPRCRYGVTGAPTFVIGLYGVVGAQPYETLEELVRKTQEHAEG